MSTNADELAILDRVLAGDPADAELAAIVAAAREDRAEPSREFRSALDAQVAARFRRRRPPRRLIFGGAAASAVAAGVALVVVLSGPTGSGPRPVESLAPQQTATTAVAPATSGGTGERSAAPAAGPTAAGETQPRRVQRDATLTVATSPSRVDAVARDITAAVDRFGGVVQRSSVSSSGGGANQASFDVSIPARSLEPALSAISALGHVRSRTQNTQDVTQQYNGLRGQLTEAAAERQGLLRQLAAATTPNATASLKARLRLLTARISSLRSQTRSLSQSTGNARVAITVLSDAASTSGAWTLGDAANAALQVLVVCAGVLLIGLAALLPLVLLAGVAMLLRRRRREGALDRSI